MHQTKTLSRNKQYILLLLTPLYFTIIGLFLQPLPEIMDGLWTIIKEPDFLITDYVELAGIGATFVNASLTMFAMIILMYIIGSPVNGAGFGALWLMLGFSMFGKNIANIWPIILGTFLYSRFRKEPFSKNINLAIYATALGPIVTATAQIEAVPESLRLIAALAVGIFIGFVMVPVAGRVSAAHKGYSLYNAGFADGFIALAIMSVYKAFGFEFGSRKIWATGYNNLFMKIMIPYCLLFILTALIIDRNAFRNLKKLIALPGIGGTDFAIQTGWSATLLNVGLSGILSVGYLYIIGADLNGASIGGVLSVIGFAACGKHIKNMPPIMLGITLASLSPSWSITDPGPVLALCFGMTLSPIAGEFGFIAGLITGFFHAGIVQNVGVVYSGMNLYNNGFAGGLLATFLTPVLMAFREQLHLFKWKKE